MGILSNESSAYKAKEKLEKIYSNLMNLMAELYNVQDAAKEIAKTLETSEYGILEEDLFNKIEETGKNLIAMSSVMNTPINKCSMLLLTQMKLDILFENDPEKENGTRQLELQLQKDLPEVNAIAITARRYIESIQPYLDQMSFIQKLKFGQKSALDEEKIKHLVTCFKKASKVIENFKNSIDGPSAKLLKEKFDWQGS